MNILLTSAGRRSYLVEYFKKALIKSGKEGKVFASNSCMSPALNAADEYTISPLIHSPEYIDFLLSYCKKNEIKLVVPLFDIDLSVLSKKRSVFENEGICVAVSDIETLNYCSDKYAMSFKLWKNGIRCPETEINVDDALLKVDCSLLSYPLIIKPRFGMGSIGVTKAYNKNELKVFCESVKRQVENSYLKYEQSDKKEECVIISEMLCGNEYGMDIINDFSGNYVTTVVRRKIAMRSGETDEAIVLGKESDEYKVLSKLGEKLSSVFSIRGIMDVDVIMNTGNMAPYVIDMNARFGGGYPFSHLAGIDLPRAYIYWADGEKAPEDCFFFKEMTHGYKDMVMGSYQ